MANIPDSSMIAVTGVPAMAGRRNHTVDVIDRHMCEVMTKVEFLDCLIAGGFTDDDGIAELCDGTFHSLDADYSFFPSDVGKFEWPRWATHVMWFNK